MENLLIEKDNFQEFIASLGVNKTNSRKITSFLGRIECLDFVRISNKEIKEDFAHVDKLQEQLSFSRKIAFVFNYPDRKQMKIWMAFDKEQQGRAEKVRVQIFKAFIEQNTKVKSYECLDINLSNKRNVLVFLDSIPIDIELFK